MHLCVTWMSISLTHDFGINLLLNQNIIIYQVNLFAGMCLMQSSILILIHSIEKIHYKNACKYLQAKGRIIHLGN